MQPKYKYALIKKELLSQIESGALKPHDKLLTQSQIIAKYNTSVTTAGRVLNELAFEGYAYRVQGKGTYVAERKPQARKLCFSVPFIVRDNMRMSYPASSSILLDCIYNECRMKGWNVQLHISPPDTSQRAQALANSIAGVDGVMLCQAFVPGMEEEIAVLQAAGIPFVVLDTYIDAADVGIVSSDGRAAAIELTRQLHNRGCDHIVFWGRTADNADTSMLVRREGYCAAMRKLKRREELILHSIMPDEYQRDTQAAVDHIFSLEGMIGIVSDHVGHLQGLCDCIMLNNKPTANLVLADFDDYPVRLLPPVPVFSMSRPFREMAELSMVRIMELFNGKANTDHDLLPSKLTQTTTVGTLSQQIDLHREHELELARTP